MRDRFSPWHECIKLSWMVSVPGVHWRDGSLVRTTWYNTPREAVLAARWAQWYRPTTMPRLLTFFRG